jgi:SagB-type dehydrogenase family enzyme
MTFHLRIKSSQCLVSVPCDQKLLVYNFLTQRAVTCSTDAIFWIAQLSDWETIDGIAKRHPHVNQSELSDQIWELVKNSVLISEGSSEHKKEAEFLETWEWGIAAGMFHFSLLNNSYADSAEGVRKQLNRAVTDPSPPLFRVHKNATISLPQPQGEKVGNLLSLMKARRTNRVPGFPSIELGELSDCLYAGMAITGTVKTPTGELPLQMTPAGGARNAYEAFVLVNWVEGIDAGIYHYSATQHSLALVNKELPSRADPLLAQQEWVNEKPAIIFLVAHLERVMWKYHDPNGYRVVLMEAGHKGQNIALAATAHGMSACPTAALNHDLISKYLCLDRITHSPIYALTLSKPGLYDSEIHPFVPANGSEWSQPATA